MCIAWHKLEQRDSGYNYSLHFGQWKEVPRCLTDIAPGDKETGQMVRAQAFSMRDSLSRPDQLGNLAVREWLTGELPHRVEQEIKTLYEGGKQAALKGDAAYVEKHYAADFVGIAGSTGNIIAKNEVIQRLKSGAVKYESITDRDVKVRVYGNTAIVNSAATVKATSDGKPISGDYRGTWVYVKQHGEWKLVSGQSTPIKTEKK